MLRKRQVKFFSWVLSFAMVLSLIVLPVSATETTEGSEGLTTESEGTVAANTAVEDVQALIDALPSADEVAAMDLEEQNEIYMQASAIWDAYYELTEDEQALVDISALEQLADYFNGGIMTLSSTTQEASSVASVSIDGTTTYYDSVNDALGAVTAGTTGTVTLLCDAALSGNKVLKGNLTFDLGGYTLSTGSYTLSLGSSAAVMISNGTITGSAAGSQSGIIKMTYSSASLEINGVKITNTTTSTSTSNVVYLDPSENITFKATNCSFDIKSSNGRVMAGGSGTTGTSSSVILTGCTLTSAYRTLVLTGKYAEYIIDGCTIETTSADVDDAAVYLSTSKTEKIDITNTEILASNDAASIGSNNSSSATSKVYLSGNTIATSSINNTKGGHRIIVSGGYYQDYIDVYDNNVYVRVADGYKCVELTADEKAKYPECNCKVVPDTETFTVYYGDTSYEIEVEAGKTYDLTQAYDNALGYGIPANYLYGGVFSDSTYTTVVSGCGTGVDFTPVAGATYYVKLVSDSYFQVKCLYSYINNKINSLWPIMGIDSSSYKAYGFLIDGKTEALEKSDTAYEQATIELEGYESTTITCKEAFGVDGYLGILKLDSDTLASYATSDGTITMTIQPYYVTLDGVMVTGTISRSVTFTGGYAGKDMTSSYTDTTVTSTTSIYEAAAEETGETSGTESAVLTASLGTVSRSVLTSSAASISAVSAGTSGEATTSASGSGSGTAMLPGGLVIDNEYVITNITYEAKLTRGELSTLYKTLEEAIAAAESGDVITLLTDVTVESMTEIKSSQDITLNLASYTITGEMSTRLFAVSGTLTIKAEDDGKIINTGSSNVISNGGKLIIESGVIEASSAYAIYNTGTLTVNDGTFTGGISGTGYALYNASGTITINGGTFTSTNTSVGAVRNNGTLTVNDGTIGDTSEDVYGVYNAGNVIVNGGTLSGSTAGLINTTSDSKVVVNAGTFQGGKRGLYNSTGTADIYGGTFSGTEYGLMTNSPDSNITTVYAGTFNGDTRAIIGYLTSTIDECSAITSGSYDQNNCVVEVVKFAVTLVDPNGTATEKLIKIEDSETSYDLTLYVPEGYLYGGLYYDKDCTEAVDSADNNGVEFLYSADDESNYYIKLVSDSYFRVKCLYSYVDNQITNLWPIIGIDSDSYSMYGFLINGEEVEVDEDEGNTTAVTGNTNIAYNSVTINLEGYTGTTATCSGVFSVDGYLGVMKMDADFLESYEEDETIELTITPFFVTTDGVMVTGVIERTVKFENGYAGAGFSGYADVTVESTTCLYTESGDFSDPENIVSVASLELASSYLVEDDSEIDSESGAYTVTKYDGGEVYTQKIAEDETDYIITYAGQTGSVFAGWYTDENYTTPADFSEISGDMTVYAKYVSADYLVAKTAALTSKGNLTGIRSVAAVDSKNYAEVGFDYAYNDGTSVSAAVSKYSTTVSGKTARKLYGGDVTSSAKLIYNDLSVSGIEAGTQITITPYWITLDGTKVTGTAKTVIYTGSSLE